MIIGSVYVITTDVYEQKDIYKIGCTKNLDQRLTAINATRIKDDSFRVVFIYESINYFDVEQSIHRALAGYRLNNEFFQCPLETIKRAIEIKKGSFSSHKDWLIQHYLSLPAGEQPSSSDESILKLIQEILATHDKYNLYRYINSQYLQELVAFYRSIQPNAKLDVSLVKQMNALTIDTQDLVAGTLVASLREIHI